MNITSQLHGAAKFFKHQASLFEQFAERDEAYMLLKIMATPRRNCLVPAQAEFFFTKEELLARRDFYKKTDVRENGLDVMFVDGFEWDLGINYVQ